MTANGALPANIHCARDYEGLAQTVLDPAIFAHLIGGAGRGRAALANLEAFDAQAITPRLLRDLSAGSTRCRLGGRDLSHPILLAPVAFQALFHPGAEREAARGADAAGAILTLSTLSSVTLEAAAEGAATERWFQLYPQPTRDQTLDLVRRAEAAGYGALVVTADAPVQTQGLASLQAGFRNEARAANIAPAQPPAIAAGESPVFQGLMRQAQTWEDIDGLRQATSLPIWLKGVLHPADAARAAKAGLAGLVVSNHGGRTLDSAPATLSVLPAVRGAVGHDMPIVMDGGVRSGEDVFKALAAGADAVMVGRLQACALAVAGALGVAHMVRLLRQELEVAMALAGCASLADIRSMGC